MSGQSSLRARSAAAAYNGFRLLEKWGVPVQVAGNTWGIAGLEEQGGLKTQLTELLGRLQSGDVGARDALFATAYPELHRLARARLRDGGRNSVLDTTSLVHESYLRFIRVGELRAEDRRAFFAYASQVMRHVVVNAARDRKAEKRGGGAQPLTLSTHVVADLAGEEGTILGVHEALEELQAVEPRLAQVTGDAIFWGLQRPGDC